jgi:hypothetical protein
MDKTIDLSKVIPDELSDAQLKMLENIIKEKKKNKKIIIEKVSNDNPKYLITLKLINAILENNNLPSITDILSAKELFREYFLIDNADKIVEEFLQEILTIFTKQEIGYIRKDKTQSYLTTLVKSMVKSIGYKILNKTKRTNKQKNLSCTEYYYSIES